MTTRDLDDMAPMPTPRNGWRKAILEDLVVFQRGYDITKAEQEPETFLSCPRRESTATTPNRGRMVRAL